MNLIEKFLQDHKVLILDGAMATELEGKGLDLNDALWSAKVLAERPDVIEQVHYEYFQAGADCAMTASYQATIEGFLKKGYSLSQAEKFISDSVSIAVKARDRFWQDPENRKGRPYPLIVAAVGPYGAYLADGSEYRGDYDISEQELMDFHRRRMQLLLEAGADILACETVPCASNKQGTVSQARIFLPVKLFPAYSKRRQWLKLLENLMAPCVGSASAATAKAPSVTAHLSLSAPRPWTYSHRWRPSVSIARRRTFCLP